MEISIALVKGRKFLHDEYAVNDRRPESVGELSFEEERRLLERTRTGDLHARGQIALAHGGIIRKLALRYGRFGLPLDDLIQEGYLAIYHAIERFQPQGTTRLASYACWWIRHFMWRAIAAQRGPLRVPAPLLRRLGDIHCASERLSRQLRREPTCQEVAKEMGCPATQIRTLRQVSGEFLPGAAGAGQAWAAEQLPDVSQPTPLEHITSTSLHDALRSGLERLSRQEAKVLRLHYGLDGALPMTLEHIGKRHALSRESVRQLEQSALRKLRGIIR
jgi:RNA polymerase primary sigma factor